MLTKWTVTFVVVLFTFLAGASPTWARKDHFVGEVVAKMLPDGRNMKLVQPFGYIDTQGHNWDVPAGMETDGASIPEIFWLRYPPFTGLYRSAAVIHDYYCQTRSHTWQETHNVFYDAMRTAGVDEVTAKTMWAAVYYMGPRWVKGGAGLSSNGPGPTELQDQEVAMRQLSDWISKNNPSRDEIAKNLNHRIIPK